LLRTRLDDAADFRFPIVDCQFSSDRGNKLEIENWQLEIADAEVYPLT
jgi:hypothetical protein